MFDTLQAGILDLSKMITDQPTALHITTQLSQRVLAVLARPRACANIQAARRPS
jgi:hypothetical protein